MPEDKLKKELETKAKEIEAAVKLNDNDLANVTGGTDEDRKGNKDQEFCQSTHRA